GGQDQHRRHRQAQHRHPGGEELRQVAAPWRFAAQGNGDGVHRAASASSRTRGSSSLYRMSTTRLSVTNRQTITTRYDTMTGRSRALMLSRISLPAPGHEKMLSVTTAKAMVEPSSSPSTVTSGISVLRSTCTPTTRSGDRPLARANLT